MATIELNQLVKRYGKVEAVKGIDLAIEDGEFVVFVGPSGCGKSTTLRMIAGLEEISDGTLKIAGNVVNEKEPKQRNIAMVFQNYAIYPHMTVRQNIGFGLYTAKLDKTEKNRRIEEAGRVLGLEALLDRRPAALSGGQRQRVAIGRAICRNPKVFLFDEPLSNLDAALRVATRIEIAKLNEQMADTTMIYVTHDQVEAMTLADRIVVLNAGRVEQVGPPLELYERPANLFVAKFIGSPAMNIIAAKIVGTGERTSIELAGGKTLAVDVPTPATEQGKAASFGVRPEDLSIVTGDDYLFEGKVAIVEALGEVTLLYLEAPKGQEPIIVKVPGIVSVGKGETLRFAAPQEKLHLFDAAGKTYRP